jgi:hypothetical protein
MQNKVQALADTQSVSVIFDICRSCAQVDDSSSNWALIRKNAHFSHQVMLDVSLDFEGFRNIDLILVETQIGNLFGRDESKFCLYLSQVHPKASPE